MLLPDGRDITPDSKVQCAILAVLLFAPDLTCSRTRLLDLFWSESDTLDAQNSLRAAISNLRNRQLQELGGSAIDSKRNFIRLDPHCFEIARDLEPMGEFMEGFDLSIKGANAFEDWLREQRLDWDSRATTAPELPWSREMSWSIGILPFAATNDTGEEFTLANALMDGIIRLFAQSTMVSVFDLRGSSSPWATPPKPSEISTTFLIHLQLLQHLGRSEAVVKLLHAKSRKVVWCFDPIDLIHEDYEVAQVNVFEVLVDKIARFEPDGVVTNLIPWSAISALFSLDFKVAEETDKVLEALTETREPGVVRCLQFFAQIFRENEGYGTRSELTREDLSTALEAVPFSSPLRPLCESLVGYSAHMLLSDNDLSFSMLETAYGRAPRMALNLDHLAVLRLSVGDLTGAERAFRSCMRGSELSSWRYTYEVTGSMIAMAKGDFKTSLTFANRALMRKPKFVGALRYAMLGFLLSENAMDAQRMKKRLLQLRPEYDLSGWFQSFMGRSDPIFANNVEIMLSKYNIL